MCDVYEVTKIVGQETKVERIISKYSKKLEGATAEQCPKYKFHPSSSSRQIKNLPTWAFKT